MQSRHEDRILAGRVEKDVTFVEIDEENKINTQIDAAYRAKYHRSVASIIESAVSAQARSAIISLEPRSTSA